MTYAMRLAVLTLTLVSVLSAIPARADPKMRGMTVSCPGYGSIWGSPDFSKALTELKTLGVNWVSIHPYAGISRSGQVRWTPATETGYLPAAVKRAQKAGIKLFWKPHIAYWGSFKWRGSITFDNQRAQKRFAQSYRAFILDQARFAESAKVPLFAMGVEFEQLVKYTPYWVDLIKDIRKVYSGKLTYAANWDGVQKVQFWDKLDYIGIQAYYPLSIDTSSQIPPVDTMRKAWKPLINQLQSLSRTYNRSVIFAEIGYPEAAHAAKEPWKNRGYLDAPARELRRKLVETALMEVAQAPFIAGLFWWKWIPGRKRGDFAMQPPEIQSLLRQYWRSPY